MNVEPPPVLGDSGVAEACRILKVNNCGEPVGWQRITADQTNEPPCALGCFAPGSSPHRHIRTIGYHLIGSTGTVDVDRDLEPLNVRTLYPFN